MTDTKNYGVGGGPGSLEGQAFHPVSISEASEAVELAFDYRGDVTIELSSGKRIEGYVFNRSGNVPNPSLELFPKDAAGSAHIRYAEIRSIVFTGADTASGKSWEAWMKKKDSERRAEAEKVEAEARARGYL